MFIFESRSEKICRCYCAHNNFATNNICGHLLAARAKDLEITKQLKKSKCFKSGEHWRAIVVLLLLVKCCLELKELLAIKMMVDIGHHLLERTSPYLLSILTLILQG